MLRSIIVDDELRSRESLRSLLRDFCEDVKVEALCQNVDEAIEAIALYKPDFIFLDIQLQRETGFDLLLKIKKIDFDVIFTTAHSEYAIKAIKFSAVDYLLKPIDIKELQTAVQKISAKLESGISGRIKSLMENLSATKEQFKLALPTREGLVFIKTNEILYCEASSNYTFIYLINGTKHVVSRTLKEYEDLLNEYNFFRIHHSYLINMQAIKHYIKGEGGSVILLNNVSLHVSKRKRDAFLMKLGSLNTLVVFFVHTLNFLLK